MEPKHTPSYSVLGEDLLMDAQANAQSPFLPGTNIQFAYIRELADWLVDCNAY